MKVGDRIPELNIRMRNHTEERLKSLKFHRTMEAAELFYIKFPVIKGSSGKNILTGKIVVNSLNGEVRCYLYGQTGELYPAFFEHNSNVDSYIYKVNKIYLDILKEYGIKEKNDENDKRKH